jgi:hypothetical protein
VNNLKKTFHYIIFFILAGLLALSLISIFGEYTATVYAATPTPTPKPSPTATPSPTPSPTPKPSSTPTPSPTATPTPSPTATPTPSPIPTPTPSLTPNPSSTPTPTASPSGAPPSTQVNFAVSGGGSTIPSGTQSYNNSQQVSISAIADNGFAFVSWSVNPAGAVAFSNASSASATATINAACTITATFAQANYQIGFVVSGSGSISPSGLQTYPSGNVVMLSATAGSGFVFGSWSVSPGSAVAFGNASSTSTWAIINGNGNITATFNPAACQVKLNVNGGGSISPSGTQSYMPGQQVPLSATAGSGFVFGSWSVSPAGAATFSSASSASTTATINGDSIITATFFESSPTPSPNSNPTPTPSQNASPTPVPSQISSPTPAPALTSTPIPTVTTISPTITPSPTASHPTPTPNSTATPTPLYNETAMLTFAGFTLPLTLIDVSLYFAFLSIILVPTSKLLPRYYQVRPSSIRKLEYAALLVALLFLSTAAWQVIVAAIG